MHGALITSTNDTTTAAIAVCSASASAIALAACAFALPALADATSTTMVLQVTPAGAFKPADGREMVVDAWRMDAAIAASVIARFDARNPRQPVVVDYEHQTLKADENGQPAPAAAWFKSLEWREGEGLFGTVELTGRARDFVATKEYRYFSPVFSFDENTGAVREILMGAFTNNPALHGMQPLAVFAAATFGLTTTQEKPLNTKLLAAVVAALALGANSTEDQAIAACTALKPKLDSLTGLRKALGLPDTATDAEAIAACTAIKAKADESAKLRTSLGIADAVASTDAIAACTAIKTKADAAAGVDPAKYAPVAALEALQAQVTALSAGTRDRDVAALVDAGLSDGRLLPALKDWATELGKKDVAALTKYLASAQPIAALSSPQTRGASLATGAAAHGLTPDQLAICSACGLTPEQFAKSLAAEKTGV